MVIGTLLCVASAFPLISSFVPLSLPCRYHRVLKKGKAKKALKEFETLRKTDPAAALEELEKLGKARMMVSLPLALPLNHLSPESNMDLTLSFLSRSE